jgi:two-component system nitrogen regulation response regulator GlnG
MLEDEPPQQEVLGVTLAVLGFDVVCAADVDEALRMLDLEIDAAILDVIVPDPKLLGRDGLTVLTALRERHPDIPVAIFTGVPLSDTDETIVSSHGAKLFPKPLPYQRLVAFLEESRAQRR